MRKLIWIIVAVILAAAAPCAAGQKPNRAAPQSGPSVRVDVNFLTAAFRVERAVVLRYAGYGLSTEELTLVFYLYSASGRRLSDDQVRFLARERNWTSLAWWLGLPPIVLEDGVFILRRPGHSRLHPPLGRNEYDGRRRGGVKESLRVSRNRYEYKYENKRTGVEEKLTITSDRYEYKYQDRAIEEKMILNLRNFQYEYKYENRRTKAEIKKKGTGRPLTPAAVYQMFRRERERDPGFHFSISVEIEIDL